MERYRDALDARKMVPEELAQAGSEKFGRNSTKAAADKKNQVDRCRTSNLPLSLMGFRNGRFQPTDAC